MLHFSTFFWSDCLELSFGSKDLRNLCEHAHYAAETLGADVAIQLRHRVADMFAATSPLDILVGDCRPSNTDEGCMVVDLCDGFVIQFSANHVSNPADHDGQIDWRKVSRVKITRIWNEDAGTGS